MTATENMVNSRGNKKSSARVSSARPTSGSAKRRGSLSSDDDSGAEGLQRGADSSEEEEEAVFNLAGSDDSSDNEVRACGSCVCYLLMLRVITTKPFMN